MVQLFPAHRLGGRRNTPDGVIVVGAGLAGLFTALKLAPLPVTVITPEPLGEGSSSAWAQGGVAAAVGVGDTPEAHAADTITAGAGLVDEAVAGMMTREGPQRIEDLLRYGAPFDRDPEGRLSLSREAAHGRSRVVRVKGDQAGKAIMAALIAAARATPSIKILEGWAASELLVSNGAVVGLVRRPTKGRHPRGRLPHYARAVVLATGGVGQLFSITTNPGAACGEGIAIAARAGAIIADAEFVQFHPTALNIGRDPAPLATEALRGEGSWLVDSRGERFMLDIHPDAELAPRDIVARAVHRQAVSGGGAWLDCREAVGARFPEHFPAVYEACRAAGLDPVLEPIPVAPAAHYHMGGVMTDARGRTSLDGLWACGEAASTGVHGANRLASNGLLEAAVFGARIAEDISGLSAGWTGESGDVAQTIGQETAAGAESAGLESEHPGARQRLRETMARHVGVERSHEGLTQALGVIKELAERGGGSNSLDNMIVAARLIVAAALKRRESRGGHCRLDYPETDPAQARRGFLTHADALATSAEVSPSPLRGEGWGEGDFFPRAGVNG